MMRAQDIAALRDAGMVKRNHCDRVAPQTLAEHSWGLCMLLLAVYPEAPAYLIAEALTHDLPERESGDTPATAKWANPSLETELRKIEQGYVARFNLPRSANEPERAILKWCDKAEYALFCIEQINQGNNYARQGLHNVWPAVTNSAPSCCAFVLAEITQMKIRVEKNHWGLGYVSK